MLAKNRLNQPAIIAIEFDGESLYPFMESVKAFVTLLVAAILIQGAVDNGVARAADASAPSASNGNAPRLWTNTAGKTVLATQIGLDPKTQTITLETADGKTYQVALATLNKADVEMALAWVKPDSVSEGSKVDQLAHEGYWEPSLQAAYEASMALLNKPAPDLALAGWTHGAMTTSETKGKIILIDFWATWCHPCLEEIPHTNAIVKKYAAQGVVVYGACCPDGAETMLKTAEDNHMTYSTGKLSANDVSHWKIAFWPTYAIIDRSGELRAIGLRPDYVEQALNALLLEQPTTKQTAAAN